MSRRRRVGGDGSTPPTTRARASSSSSPSNPRAIAKVHRVARPDGDGSSSSSSSSVPIEVVVLRPDASVPPASVLDVVVIPGNPGVPAFYAHYARTLWTQLAGRARVEIVGYLGHSVDDIGTDAAARWFTLAEQLDHVVTYLRDREPWSVGDDEEEEEDEDGDESVGGAGTTKATKTAKTTTKTKKPTSKTKRQLNKTKTYLVGHSIGSEMALHALDVLGPERIERVVGLMPFLEVNKRSLHQRFLASIVRVGALVRLVARVVGAVASLAAKLRDVVFHPITRSMDEDARALTVRWLRRSSVLNMALMGRTEFDALGAPASEDARLKTHAARRVSHSVVAPVPVVRPPPFARRTPFLTDDLIRLSPACAIVFASQQLRLTRKPSNNSGQGRVVVLRGRSLGADLAEGFDRRRARAGSSRARARRGPERGARVRVDDRGRGAHGDRDAADDARRGGVIE